MSRENDARVGIRGTARPTLFAGYVALVTLTGLSLLVLLLARFDRSHLHDVTPTTWLALGLALLLVVAGEVWPVFISAADSMGVAWSATFVLPVLLHFGIVPGDAAARHRRDHDRPDAAPGGLADGVQRVAVLPDRPRRLGRRQPAEGARLPDQPWHDYTRARCS